MILKLLKKQMSSFISQYNNKFAIPAKNGVSHFSKVPHRIDLDLLLCAKFTRIIDNSGSFTILGKKFQIINNKILPNVKVGIYMS